MALGAQWYILFNVIAGASAIPGDLREAATSLRLGTVLRWRTLIGPAIFSAWVTGGITAAGGAWNASIVAEVVSYGPHDADRHRPGRLHRAVHRRRRLRQDAGRRLVMSVYVVGINRLFWRRLYRLRRDPLLAHLTPNLTEVPPVRRPLSRPPTRQPDHPTAAPAIIEVDRCPSRSPSADGTTLPVLDDVTLTPARRRDRRPAGQVGLGQVHPAALPSPG
jgi:hypothetical protein